MYFYFILSVFPICTLGAPGRSLRPCHRLLPPRASRHAVDRHEFPSGPIAAFVMNMSAVGTFHFQGGNAMSSGPNIEITESELADVPGTPPKEIQAATGTRTDWFPTSIWRFTVAGHEALNEKLMRFIEEERQRNPAGLKGRSSVMGWHSTNHLHRRPEMQEIVAAIAGNVAEVARAHRIDPRQAELELATCWVIVNGKMATGALHCHPNSFLSGVYYVNTTENTGDIFFQDPRPGANMTACPVTEYTPLTIRQISYKPTPGGMLLFPSWLYHGVGPNLSDTPRVSMSFNFRLRWTAGS